MPNIHIRVNRKRAINPQERLVCGNKDYAIVFTFDTEWDAYETKTARFIYGGQFTDVVFEGNTCPVPQIVNVDFCAVGVFAGDLHTTTPALIGCDKSILCSSGAPAEPTPGVYAQIMELLEAQVGGYYVPEVTQSAPGTLDVAFAPHGPGVPDVAPVRVTLPAGPPGELSEQQGNTLYSNALKGAASGAYVRLGDVSPLEHSVKVKVSGVTDPAAVTVYARGKNLFEHVECEFVQGAGTGFDFVKTETGYRVAGAATSGCFGLFRLGSLAELGGKKLTRTAEMVGPGKIYFVICASDFSGRTGSSSGKTYTVPQASDYPEGHIVALRLNGDENGDPSAVVTYDNIQVEFGDTATEYEPYQHGAEYTPAEDGTCEVTSIASTMTLHTNNPDAVIDCQYNRDINTAFDQLVQAVISMGGNV